MKPHVLIVDDEEDIRSALEMILNLEGMTTSSTDDGSKVMACIAEKFPDVIILDRLMKNQGGIETCKELNADGQTQSIPIIMLTALGTGRDTVEGLDAGADDYLVKPFENDELIARIKRLYRRSMQMKDISPLTALPGNNRIMEAIESKIHEDEDFSVLYFDLDNFKPYNDKYGFLKGDEVIKFTMRCILDSATFHDENSFVGHIGGDDFVVISTVSSCEDIAKNAIADFDDSIKDFYSTLDSDRGFILQEDRRGQEQRYEVVALSCGIASTKEKNYDTAWEIVDVATTMKRVAKNQETSSFAHDKRRGEE
jgi:diguanylate cyclase (GGDEF)-like protein